LSLGLTTAYEERETTGAALIRKEYTWTQDGNLRPYVGTVVTTLNPGTGSAAQTKSTQTLDIYGNLTQSQVFHYGNLVTPARTYNYSYLHQSNGNYAARYIFNRLTSATVNDGSGAQSLVANVYDQGATTAYGAPLLHDSANYGPGLVYRGNVTRRDTASGTTITYYLTTGVANIVTNEAGVTINNSTSGATGYSLPEVITPGGNGNLATSIGYNSSWGVMSVTGANGANATTSYDSYGRPVSSKIPDGAITNYTYTYNPNTQTATLGTRWTKTTLDGFGRPTTGPARRWWRRATGAIQCRWRRRSTVRARARRWGR
jgi:YD repeat-containing protein